MRDLRLQPKNLIYAGILSLIFYLTDKGASLYHRMDPSLDTISRITATLSNYGRAFVNPLPSFSVPDMEAGLTGVVICTAVYLIKKSDVKKFRRGEEYGSARWGNRNDIRPYMDERDKDNNVILTKTEMIRLKGRFSHPKYEVNKNVLVVGGSGSGKTRFYVKPQLMQMNASYVVTDPKGTVLLECGKMLERGPVKRVPAKTGKYRSGKDGRKHPVYRKDNSGNIIYEPLYKNGKPVHEPYDIKVFNTINFEKSMHYNPFAYLHKEEDIITLVNTLIENTKGEGEKSSEDFWVQAERLLYMAYIGYLYYEAPESEQNFATLLELINASEVREDTEDYRNAVDLLFEDLSEQAPDHFAVRMYKKYKLAAGKTAKSILISCAVRLAPFDIARVREITSYDELSLDTLGDHLSALFIIISDTNTAFNFLVSILYTQLFNLLCEKADDVYGGRLPVHVRCLCDEFANVGTIPRFEKLIATIRSREISASIVLQTKSQLKALYKENAGTIIGNCDARLFLGGSEEETLKGICEELGKETIDQRTTSVTKGSQQSSGINNQKLGRELMTRDELAVMDGGKCILQLRGVRPFLSDKYDITKHERYRLLKDYDKRNAFDIKRFLERKKREHDLDIDDIASKHPKAEVITIGKYDVTTAGA